MVDAIRALADTPVPTILVVAGIVFLLLSVADKLSAQLSVPDQRRRHAQILGGILLVIGVALNLQPGLPPAPESSATASESQGSTLLAETRTDWMTANDYQGVWKRESDRGYYPVEVEGMNQDGISLYRGIFRPRPASVASWASHHGLTRDQDAKIHADLIGSGFKRIWTNSFVDGGDEERFQGVWVQVRQE